MESHTVSQGQPGSIKGTITETFKKLVGPCPVTAVRMGGVEVNCLIDTGSMVSMVTELL